MLNPLARGAREFISKGSAFKPWRTGVGGQIAQRLHFSGRLMAWFTSCLNFFSCYSNKISWQTQLQWERVDFNLQFQGHVAYNGKEDAAGRAKWQEAEALWLHCIHTQDSREWGTNVCHTVLTFLLDCPGYQLGNGATHSRRIFLPP